MESMIRKWGGGEILKRAVRGMLPKNRLRDKRLERLKGEFCARYSFLAAGISGGLGMLIWCDGVVFEGEAHPYGINLIKFNDKIRTVEPDVEAEVEAEVLKQDSN